jgi:hypothetical protein
VGEGRGEGEGGGGGGGGGEVNYLRVCFNTIAICIECIEMVFGFCFCFGLQESAARQAHLFDQFAVCLPVLARVLHTAADDQVLIDALWTVSYLSIDAWPNNLRVEAVLLAGLGPRLVQLLMHKSFDVIEPALRAVGNIVAGTDHHAQILLNAGVLRPLLSLLGSSEHALCKEACRVISNIAAGSGMSQSASLVA